MLQELDLGVRREIERRVVGRVADIDENQDEREEEEEEEGEDYDDDEEEYDDEDDVGEGDWCENCQAYHN